MKKSNILSRKMISVCLALACALSMAFMTSCSSEAGAESPDASPSLSSEVPMSSPDERMPSVLEVISPGVLTDFFPFDPSQVTTFEHTVVYQGPTVSENSVCLEGDDAVDAAQQLADFVVLSDESISGRTTAGGSYIRYTMWFGEETMTICYAGTFHADTLESQPLCYIDGEHYKDTITPPDIIDITLPDASPATIDEEIIIITPNRDLPNDGPPQPDGPPTVMDEETSTRSYSEGTIIVSYAEIMGAVHAVEVDDEAVKDQILAYVDGMQPSDYNAMNTPPGGRVLDVEVHRNGLIEQYAFSEIVVDGNSLGKTLQDSDKTKWTIVDKDAFEYLIHLFDKNEYGDNLSATITATLDMSGKTVEKRFRDIHTVETVIGYFSGLSESSVIMTPKTGSPVITVTIEDDKSKMVYRMNTPNEREGIQYCKRVDSPEDWLSMTGWLEMPNYGAFDYFVSLLS